MIDNFGQINDPMNSHPGLVRRGFFGGKSKIGVVDLF